MALISFHFSGCLFQMMGVEIAVGSACLTVVLAGSAGFGFGAVAVGKAVAAFGSLGRYLSWRNP